MTIPGMISELNEISKSEDLTDLEKGKAKGGAVGETVGAISGAAAGALAGAAIGSVIPGPGTAWGP
jgi:phage tail tape-measure protein